MKLSIAAVAAAALTTLTVPALADDSTGTCVPKFSQGKIELCDQVIRVRLRTPGIQFIVQKQPPAQEAGAAHQSLHSEMWKEPASMKQ